MRCLFNEDHAKFIAEFYCDNYEIMTGLKQTSEINRKRGSLYRQLRDDLNAGFGTNFSLAQIKDKLKNLKKSAKEKWRQRNAEERPTGGGEPEMPDLTSAESLIIAKLGNTPGFIGVGSAIDSGRRIETSDASLRQNEALASPFIADERNEDVVDESVDFETSIVITENVSSVANLLQPGGLFNRKRAAELANSKVQRSPKKTSSPKRLQTSAYISTPPNFPSTATKDDVYSTKCLQGVVLRLQKKLYEEQLKMQIEKRKAIDEERRLNDDKSQAVATWKSALTEFRYYIAEQRMSLRGMDVSGIPIELPPSLDPAL